ncbi:ras-related protein SEC4-like [Gigantopelta aegis]|uniref:ras-related protein SEC4-like n=1 Tax=Gigantopelta aegis TaxID=1735272 RepID=UPI001B88B20F|nr:ras-related protein SEC4-like [Gigantopelta aegis]
METVDLKVIIIGDAGVGKTSLMYRLVRDKFDPAFLTTIGVDFLRKKVSGDEQTYQLVLWDTAGAERFTLVFSVDNRDSFNNLDKWYNECIQYTQVNIEHVPFVLLGNKTDLETVITADEVKTWCDKHHNIPYVETSAKNGTGVQEGFELIMEGIPDLKVRLIGDVGVGKTSLMYRFARDTFGPDIPTSIGVDFLRKKVSIDEETYQSLSGTLLG